MSRILHIIVATCWCLPTLAFSAFTRQETGTDPGRFLTDRPAGRELALTKEEPAFTFAVFGDRTGGPADGVKILAQAVEEVNLIAPDLVMTVGDLVQGYGQEAAWMREMHEYRDIMDGLDSPWFPVAGNHDVYWRGPQGQRPDGENQDLFEAHFGPLWYAFRHKDSWFIVLYSDEGDPATGRKDFQRPAAQQMSAEQFSWLEETLARTGDGKNVFVFLHHPRWLGRGYGDDWERVHALLARAGNVRAVFAGHIHHMHYGGRRDGIEYFTLATVGGAQSGLVPSAGYLHHYELVTVRESGIAVTSYPVGSASDPRAITEDVLSAIEGLVPALTPKYNSVAKVHSNQAVEGEFEWTFTNPTDQAVELQLIPSSEDSRWLFIPQHQHSIVQPGASATHKIRLLRGSGGIDLDYRAPQIEVAADYLAGSTRFPIPARMHLMPLDVSELDIPESFSQDLALTLDGVTGHASIPSENLVAPGVELTVEFQMQAARFRDRQGLVAKTESSEWGFFANRGQLEFIVHLGGQYLRVSDTSQVLQSNRWYHIAGVYDGAELRLYVDGMLKATALGTGDRRRNGLPLVIGGDVNGNGLPVDLFAGSIDELRISTAARYEGVQFEPPARHEADEHTALLLHMDSSVGPWIRDDSSFHAHPMLSAGARLEAPE